MTSFWSHIASLLASVEEIAAIPATLGELWIIGYLLIYGVRSSASIDVEQAARSSAAAP